ncbi:MAG TPA: hypothetical protein VGE67_18595 [Haloferula sp.]
MKAIADKSLSDFFEFHRARVTDGDIRDMVPNDPGYGGYVRFLKEIRKTSLLPNAPHGDLWEVVCAPPIGPKKPLPSPEAEQFQASMVRYRNFVFSIALGSVDTGADNDWIWLHPISWLLEDADRRDRSYLRLLRSALDATGEKLADSHYSRDAPPFFTLGVLILSSWLKDSAGASAAAKRIIREDGDFRTDQKAKWGQATPGFLWDIQKIVSKDRLAALKRMATEIQNPANDFDVECVLRSL